MAEQPDDFDDPETLDDDAWDDDAVDESGELDELGATFPDDADEDDVPPLDLEDDPEAP